MPSCCKQVREFVDFGKHLHGKIKELYQDLNEHAEFERVKMLLDFLSRHEEHMEESLARFEKDARKSILEAWLEYSPELNVDAVMARFPVHEKPSSDEIFQLAMDFDDTLVKLYREVAEKVNDSKTKDVFKNLLQLEEKEKIQVARAAMALNDM
jgi:rubrerythrin